MSPEDRDINLEQRIARANEARAVLENKLVRETLDKIREDIVDQWASCPARDTEGREWLWRHYQAAAKFAEKFALMVEDGDVAYKERKLTLVERMKHVVGEYGR